MVGKAAALVAGHGSPQLRFIDVGAVQRTAIRGVNRFFLLRRPSRCVRRMTHQRREVERPQSPVDDRRGRGPQSGRNANEQRLKRAVRLRGRVIRSLSTKDCRGLSPILAVPNRSPDPRHAVGAAERLGVDRALTTTSCRSRQDVPMVASQWRGTNDSIPRNRSITDAIEPARGEQSRNRASRFKIAG